MSDTRVEVRILQSHVEKLEGAITRAIASNGGLKPKHPEMYRCVGHAFEVRFRSIQIHQSLVNVFGFTSGYI
jgi:hypothetical protein